MELHKRPEPVQGVRCHTREGLNIPPKLQVVGMKYCVQLPLFSHIVQIPEHGELCSEWLEWLDVREGHTFHYLSSSKHDEDQEPTKVELIALILSFTAIQF